MGVMHSHVLRISYVRTCPVMRCHTHSLHTSNAMHVCDAEVALYTYQITTPVGTPVGLVCMYVCIYELCIGTVYQ